MVHLGLHIKTNNKEQTSPFFLCIPSSPLSSTSNKSSLSPSWLDDSWLRPPSVHVTKSELFCEFSMTWLPLPSFESVMFPSISCELWRDRFCCEDGLDVTVSTILWFFTGSGGFDGLSKHITSVSWLESTVRSSVTLIVWFLEENITRNFQYIRR